MLIPLTCIRTHPNTPALRPGETFALETNERGEWELRIAVTPLMLRQIGQAIGEGALVLDPEASPPTRGQLAELAEIIRIGLMERATAALAQPSAPHLHLLVG